MGGPNAGPPMLHWLTGDGELTQVVANHLQLDFHLVEGLPIVHAHHAATISGRMIMPRRCVNTISGFSKAMLPSWPCAGALAVSAASSADRGSAASAAWHCTATSAAHRPCEVAGRDPRRVGERLRKVRCFFGSTSAILSVLRKDLNF